MELYLKMVGLIRFLIFRLPYAKQTETLNIHKSLSAYHNRCTQALLFLFI